MSEAQEAQHYCPIGVEGCPKPRADCPKCLVLYCRIMNFFDTELLFGDGLLGVLFRFAVCMVIGAVVGCVIAGFFAFGFVRNGSMEPGEAQGMVICMSGLTGVGIWVVGFFCSDYWP